MKGDSAATSHYLRPQDKECLTDITNYSGPSVMLPDADKISPSHQGTLNIHDDLSSAAKVGTILPQLKSSSLLSLGQLCDDGCEVLLRKKNLYALKNKQIILKGYRNNTDGLWDIPVAKHSIQSANLSKPPLYSALHLTSATTELTPKDTIKDHNINDSSLRLVHANPKDTLQQDIKNSQLAKINPSINVILRKKQPTFSMGLLIWAI